MDSASGSITTDVLIVGAGPSGLMLAVCLAKLGVDAIIVDAKDGPTRESRALGVQARSMELYDQLGLIDRVLAERAPAAAIAPGAGHRAFGTIEFRGLGDGITPYPDITVFEQSRNERLLVDALAAAGREVLWGHRLERLEVERLGREDGAGAEASAVVAELAAPDGVSRTVRARYCVGADGAHSPVRETLGIPFEGVTNEYTYYIADALDVTGLVGDAINLRFTTEHFVLAFPMGGGRMRLLGIVRDADLDADGSLREERMRELVDREFGVEYAGSAWFTTYRVHHRLAARFRDGPCFVVGDAAHIHSPVGAQGMNTGLQEAHNLACALADVIVGGMPDARLDRYEAERRPVGATLVATTDRLFGEITSESRFARFLRGRALPALGPVGVRLLPLVAGRRVFGYLSQTRIRYQLRDAAGRGARSGGRRRRREAAVGVRLPWTGDNYDVLRSMQWQVHGYGVPERVVLRIARELGVEPHVFPSDRGVRGRPRLRHDRVYLVRRDGFVMAEVRAPGVGADLDAARAAMFAPTAG
ncbi:FAD-dependent monooxygenase [Agromyces endophyticus]|uniref:FAD-dependent monooxygenase n=1 Tax=Agromyces sp. H17E-10 TaxID=2932244 RepID=UPI001FD34058|nr:FAD-dependent monooxygenase [Agromyces sp. H17E-10]UOQ90937.1 FAD-dependent monooxygenase [Agromyces sp. H17E-10]